MWLRLVWAVCLLTIFLSGVLYLPALAGPGWVPAVDTSLWSDGTWWINAGNLPVVQDPMQVFVDGVDKGTAYALTFGYQLSSSSWPEFAVLYNTGYIRLKPLDALDPYGTSFILGPGYWDSNENYYHNIQISRVDIDTSQAESADKIVLSVTGQDYGGINPSNLQITYSLVLPVPTPIAARIQVIESYTVINPFSLSTVRQTTHEAFKWAQFSSMFISLDQNPGDGLGDHDSDGAQFTGKSGKEYLAQFTPGSCDQFIFADTETMNPSRLWVQSRHSDNLGWQGNTPNTLIQLNTPGVAASIIPQGYIQCDNNHDNDNVGLWMNSETAPTTFSAGMTDSISYTLIAQDNPAVTTIDNNAYEVLYNGWRGKADKRASGGGYRYAATLGQTTSFTTAKAATSVAFMTYRGPDQGKVQVYIDGKLKETLDLYRPSPQFKFVRAYNNLPNTKHTLSVKVLGQKNAQSTGKQVRVDAFRAGASTVDESHWSVSYGNWSGKTNSKTYLRNYRFTSTKNQFVVFTIFGATFNWITATGPSFGKAQIYVDGILFKTFDLYSPTVKWKANKIISGLSNKKHTIKILVIGQHNPKATGNTVVFDGFVDP